MTINQYDDLTEQQRQFADYYLDLSNGTQSAIKAGYAKESAHVAASRLLKNDKVRKYMAEIRQQRRERVNSQLSKYAEDAVKMLYDLALTADSEAVRTQAIKDILDRAGYKPVDKTQNQSEINGKIEFGFTDPSKND
jgi:phage terminase small subunit